MSWKQFLAYNSSPTTTTYPKLPSHITFLRLFLGFAYGISLAFRENIPNITINGGVGLIFGMNVITFIPVIYMNYFLNIDNETYRKLFFAGVMNGFALMVLVWILFFTLIHEEEEGLLSAALISPEDSNSGGDVGDGLAEGQDAMTGGSGMEDSEF